MMRRILLAVLCGAALPALAEGVDMASQVDSLTITALNHVPANPAGPVSGECMFVVAEPVTPQGRGIASLGWGVTAEVAVGALGFVSFAGKAEVGSSGSCYITEGNIGIFRGGPLQGLIYAAPGAKRGIGRVTVIEGGLRVWDGDYPELPLADLRLHGDDRVVVSAVASRDRFCDGAVSLPNIYGLPIHLARRLVLAEGWVPVSADPDTPFLMPELPESQGCAATGFGICSFDYRAPNGLVLSVVTAGDPGRHPRSPSSPMMLPAGHWRTATDRCRYSLAGLHRAFGGRCVNHAPYASRFHVVLA